MAKLTDLGFSIGPIFETIVSTYNKDGSPNAAPMGTAMQNPKTVTLKIFNSSQTSFNLKTTKCAVINLTSNIEVFYKTAFKEANRNEQLPQEWFEKEEMVNAPKLRLADATIDVIVTGTVPSDAEKTNFSLKIQQINAAEMCPQVYCRAMSAALEAIIHATRIKVFVNDLKKKEHVSQLLETIKNCNDVVNRTAPNSQYAWVMADLNKRIDSWRNKP
jgi:hypothetical protein